MERVVAFDCETVSKGVFVYEPTMVSAYDGTNAYVAVGEADCRDMICALRDSGALLVGHNSFAYDVPIFRKWYPDFPLGSDTLPLAYLDDECQELSLQSLAIKYLGAQPWKTDDWSAFDEDSLEASQYAARDVIHTYNLYMELTKRLGPRKELADTVLKEAARCLGVQTLRGIPINPKAVARERQKAEEIICATTTLAASLEVNFGSSKQVAALLTKRGVSLPLSEKGNPQTSTHVLKGLDDPIAQEILRDRKAKKVISAYCIPYEKVISEGDGRVHPEYTIIRTRTGRSAARNLNVQNLSREFKDFFGPAPGKVLVECLVPGTRLLKADLTWSPVESLSVGDELVGFPENLSRGNSKVVVSVVQSVLKAVLPCARILTDRGEVTCSKNHLWITSGNEKSACVRWVAAESLREGDRIPYFVEPWDTDNTREGAYLAGFMDGEGTIGKTGRVSFGQNPGIVSEYVRHIIKSKGYVLSPARVSKTITAKNRTCETYDIPGTGRIGMRFIGSIRPVRLLQSFLNRFWGSCTVLPSRWQQYATVQNIKFVGEREVVSIKTSTGTFIAEGMLSHNCDYSAIEFRVAGWFSQDETILRNYQADPLWDPHRFFAAGFYRKPLEEVTKHERQIAKSAGFGLLYCGTGFTLVNYAAGLGIDLNEVEAEKLFRFFHATYPGFRRYYKEVKEELLANGEVACPSGHVRHYGDIHVMSYKAQRAALRQCVNVKVQNTAAYIAYIALIELDRRGLPHCGFVHDAFYFEFDSLQEAEARREEIEWVMTKYPIEYMKEHNGISFDMPLTMESKFVIGE